jgi:hypothetical protein
MRIDFFRRFRILPGLWLNVSKRSISTTISLRGLKTTFGKKGRRLTVGLPGTGLSASQTWKSAPRPADSGVGRRLLEKALSRKGRPGG